jgi:hypothetical protein
MDTTTQRCQTCRTANPDHFFRKFWVITRSGIAHAFSSSDGSGLPACGKDVAR